MKKILSLILILTLLLTLAASCSEPTEPNEPETPDTPGTNEIPDTSAYADRDVTGRNVAHVTMQIKNYGTVKLLLDATSAPRTVANFLTLAKSGFYDGLDFFTSQQFDMNSAIIMGGNPTVNGGEAAPDTVKGEFSYNGIENDLKIKRGVISMFHSQNSLDDASSAFFFSNADLTNLDGYYAPFGYVLSGYKIIDEIIKVGTYYTDPQTGLVLKARRPIITSVRVDKDIDYSLVSDVYLAPPTSAEVTEALGDGSVAERTEIAFALGSIIREYKSGDNHVFQVTSKSDSGHVNALIGVSKQGKILGAVALDYTSESFAAELPSLVGLDIAGLEASAVSSQLKAAVKDALRTTSAIFTDDSASKHLYLRDTEGRETYTVEMKVEGYDTPVVILLDKTTAPITVENFLSLVKKGFYDGLDFHRIIKGFMIQGGDDSHLPQDQQAASIKGEFAANGYENDIRHIRGTISMARSSIMDSAASGFFICDADAPHLDGGYAAFGYVISGMSTVDAIADYAVGKTDGNGNLKADVEQPKIEYIKIVEN